MPPPPSPSLFFPPFFLYFPSPLHPLFFAQQQLRPSLLLRLLCYVCTTKTLLFCPNSLRSSPSSSMCGCACCIYVCRVVALSTAFQARFASVSFPRRVFEGGRSHPLALSLSLSLPTHPHPHPRDDAATTHRHFLGKVPKTIATGNVSRGKEKKCATFRRTYS